MIVGSLFAGIGGFDLAARWMGWRTAWFSEIEPYASGVLAKHWPGVPNHGDITKIKGADVEPVDLLCGGFPCQDISVAGKGAGIDGARSGLWSHYARLIDEIRPRWVVAENVSVLRSRGLDRVLRDLDALGYDAEWHCIPASAVGAPHQRDRIWVIAYPNTNSERLQGWFGGGGVQERLGERALGSVGPYVAHPDDDVRERWSLQGAHVEGRRAGPAESEDVRRTREPRPAHARPRRAVVADAQSLFSDGGQFHGGGGDSEGSRTVSQLGVDRSADRSSDWWGAEPDVGRVAHGVPARVDRLRCLGNALVPEIPFVLFQAIKRAELHALPGHEGAMCAS